MYVDLEDKRRRSKNFIVSGLSPNSSSDTTLICDLLHSEFNWSHSELEAEIVHCKRIGKQQTGRVQPILVACQSRDTADYFTSNAKRLRRSSSDAVREKVYISADLTPSESKAAFEIRCKRREQQNKNQSQQPKPQLGTSRLVYRSRCPEASTGVTKNEAQRDSRTGIDGTRNQEPSPAINNASPPVASNLAYKTNSTTANTESGVSPLCMEVTAEIHSSDSGRPPNA